MAKDPRLTKYGLEGYNKPKKTPRALDQESRRARQRRRRRKANPVRAAGREGFASRERTKAMQIKLDGRHSKPGTRKISEKAR
jgi:hypothetical protein